MGTLGIVSLYETEIKELFYLFIRHLEKDEDIRIIKAFDEPRHHHRIVFREKLSKRAHTINAPAINIESEPLEKISAGLRMTLISISRICEHILVNIAFDKSLDKQMNSLKYLVENLNLKFGVNQRVFLLLSEVDFFSEIEMKKLIYDTVRAVKDIFSKTEIQVSDILCIYGEASEDQQIIEINNQMIKRIVADVKNVSKQLEVNKEYYKMGRKTIEDLLEELDKKYLSWNENQEGETSEDFLEEWDKKFSSWNENENKKS